jgi:hypothetical protein
LVDVKNSKNKKEEKAGYYLVLLLKAVQYIGSSLNDKDKNTKLQPIQLFSTL